MNDSGRELTVVAIEKALLDMGISVLDKVKNRLIDDYNCSISDCYDNPEYLKRILCDLYGDSYQSILNSIYDVLKDGNIEGRVEKFLKVLKS